MDLGQGSGLCPPGGQGLGEDRTEPWASSHTVLTSCCLRMVLAGCICQKFQAQTSPWGLLTLLQDHMRTHTDISVTQHKITHIISPIDRRSTPADAVPTRVHMHATLSCWEEGGD